MIKVLFVCLGNICRSPMAEGHFARFVKDNNLQGMISCDSAGTSSYHIGELPDSRMRQTALKYGISLTSRARQLTKNDLNEFDYIIAMDSSNYQNILFLQEAAEGTKAQIFMMRTFDPEYKDSDVPDPYYGGDDGFDNVYNILKRSAANLLEFIRKEHNLT